MSYFTRNILRLCERRSVQYKRFSHGQATEGIDIDNNKAIRNKNKDFPLLLRKYQDKITFSSYLENEKLDLGYFKYHLKNIKRAEVEQKKEYQIKSLSPLPVSLQYYVEEDRLLKEESERTTSIPEPEKDYQIPFANTTKVVFDKSEHDKAQTTQPISNSNKPKEFDRTDIQKWMTNYEYFDDARVSQETDNEDSVDCWSKYYGTPEPSIGVSRVPCGGCGALLHCSDPSIPGYLPSEIFKGREDDELKMMECQRCHFLKEYNIALDVNVEPEEYEKLLQSIRKVKSLVLLMVDLLDYPCSIWPGIVDIVGTDRPIIVVGNKVDLLPGDTVGYLKRIKESLVAEINKTKLGEANIKHVSLISAKTGYGVEDLISILFKEWMYKGDVYLVGCTNVGKSSLFNALLQSDYCKAHAVDIVKRATISRWPGTTLNLLKFPINRPSGWKIHQRTRRLKSDRKLMKIEKEIRNAQLEGKTPAESPALIGHIGRSFSQFHNINEEMAIAGGQRLMALDENDELFAQSKWFYDTPGVVLPDQVLSLLSTEELLLTIPKQVIGPQTYYLKPGHSIFIGGLARLDFVDCEDPCRFTIFCSNNLPITVCETGDADEVYDKFVGTELFAVPIGGEKRLQNWSGLQCSEELLEFTGEGPKCCCGDIVLSSVAWVGVTARRRTVCKVRAWTPQGRGIHKRLPSVLPFSINLKGKRIRDTPAYKVGRVFSDRKE